MMGIFGKPKMAGMMPEQVQQMPIMAGPGQMPQANDERQSPFRELPSPKRKGIFGGKVPIGDILGYIGDAFADNGPLYGQMKARERESLMDAQQREAERQARSQERWEDRMYDAQEWTRRQTWGRNNARPINNDTVADYEFVKATLGEAAAKQMLQLKVNPPQYRVGPDGRFYRIDVAGTNLPVTNDEWDSAKPYQGGPTQPASGNFR